MKSQNYINAVDKLRFSDDLEQKVRAADPGKNGIRVIRAAVLAAVLACFMVTTALGAIALLRERPSEAEILGTDALNMTDAKHMAFSVSQIHEGVEKHYMGLDRMQQYYFRHGMLRNARIGYLRVTEDYVLAPEHMNRIKLTLEKNERTYELDFDYMDTESGILSNHRNVYYKNENGEIFLNLSDGHSGQWPVYFNPETLAIVDALPAWSQSDFEGRAGGAVEIMGGILVSTIVNDGLPDSRNILYWIDEGAQEAQIIELPGNGTWYVENDTIYYQNDYGQLYGMDEEFQFRKICEYKTMDYLQDGLLTVSVRGKLGILDAYTSEVYVFENINATVQDTADYHAIRYGSTGKIALAKTQWRHDPERRVICSLGVLNILNAEMNLIQIENEYDGYQYNWLDEYRLAVIYKSDEKQILCVYEFDE